MPIKFFDTWVFSRLPAWFKSSDTYVDEKGRGLLERYLWNIGTELDQNIKSYIDNFMLLFDPTQCPSSLLSSLSFILGLPITVNNTEATYRKMLQYAVQLYKVKGTILSYKMLFNLLGLEIAIIEDTPGKPLTYDMPTPVLYDNPAGIQLYDTGCATCSGYTIAYNSAANPTNINAVDPSVLVIAQAMLPYIQPINATFNGFIPRLNLTEQFAITIEESSTLDSLHPIPGEFSDDFANTTDFD